MKMVLNRDHVLVSRCGLSFGFLAGVAMNVAPHAVQEAIAIGAQPAGDDEALEKATLDEIHAVEAEAANRAPTLEAGVRKLLERNQRGDFTAGGRPNLNVLFKETGLQVSADELEPVWNKIKAEMQ